MDVFEIIRKYTHGYVSKNDSNEDNNAFEEYECAKKEIEVNGVRKGTFRNGCK